MATCYTCEAPTEGDAEFCSVICFYEAEAEIGVPLAGISVADAIAQADQLAARQDNDQD